MAPGAVTLVGWVEAESVGGGEFNVTYEDVEALMADYFYLLKQQNKQKKTFSWRKLFFDLIIFTVKSVKHSQLHTLRSDNQNAD